MTIAIDNPRSSIARALIELVGPEPIVTDWATPFSADRFLFCGGFLAGTDILGTTADDVTRSFHENFAAIAAQIDLILDNNAEARICVIGSESGISGSHDMAYAGAKAALHLYVETKRLRTPEQQLVCIAPTVIWDSGMTQRRKDLEACHARGAARRRGEWLKAAEVARLAHFLLYVDTGSISNTVIRQNGGNW